MPDAILDRIISSVMGRLEATPARADLAEAALEAAAAPHRSLVRSTGRCTPAVIAECKKASPSAGVLRADLDPVQLASTYAAAGAAAISVVTEPDHFAGDPGWLPRVRAAVPLPVLRKDFIVCRRQLEESAVLGADAVLLIQRLLGPQQLDDLVATAHGLGLEVLLEIFADEDPGAAMTSTADLIGVNARDLSTFEMRLDRVAAIANELPTDRPRVAESGIRGRGDLDRLAEAGYSAFLVGQHLVTAEDPAAALAELTASG